MGTLAYYKRFQLSRKNEKEVENGVTYLPMIPRRQIAAEFVLLLPAGCGVVAADAIGAEPARPGSPVTACDFAFVRCICTVGVLSVS